MGVIVHRVYICFITAARWPGPSFTNSLPIAIQIQWKFRFTLPLILIQWPLQNSVHGTTAALSWHVQKFVANWRPGAELQQGKVSIELELWENIVSETGPWSWKSSFRPTASRVGHDTIYYVLLLVSLWICCCTIMWNPIVKIRQS